MKSQTKRVCNLRLVIKGCSIEINPFHYRFQLQNVSIRGNICECVLIFKLHITFERLKKNWIVACSNIVLPNSKFEIVKHKLLFCMPFLRPTPFFELNENMQATYD